MDCKEFREVLDLYIDNELSPDARTKAQIHLYECSRCRRVEQELFRLRGSLKEALSRHHPPQVLVNRVSNISQSKLRRAAAWAGAILRVDLPIWKQRIAIPTPVLSLL